MLKDEKKSFPHFFLLKVFVSSMMMSFFNPSMSPVFFVSFIDIVFIVFCKVILLLLFLLFYS